MTDITRTPGYHIISRITAVSTTHASQQQCVHQNAPVARNHHVCSNYRKPVPTFTVDETLTFIFATNESYSKNIEMKPNKDIL